jgi:hypothetical protein
MNVLSLCNAEHFCACCWGQGEMAGSYRVTVLPRGDIGDPSGGLWSFSRGDRCEMHTSLVLNILSTEFEVLTVVRIHNVVTWL